MESELRIVSISATVRPIGVENGRHTYALPKGMMEVRVISRAGAPTRTCPRLEDRRCPGVHVERIMPRMA